MTFSNIRETTTKEGQSPSGREPEPHFPYHTDRYDSPEVVRLGAIAEVSHDRGKHRESVASFWQN
jgi:hypothetical protein